MSTTTFGSCPNGGLWYTCTSQSPTFFGCCTSDPCNEKGCPASDLRAAGMGAGPGFDGSTYANDSSYYPNVKCQTGDWYTCAAASPSFQGCCEGTNPCKSGGLCPAGSLYPASFSWVNSIMDPNIDCTSGDWYSCLSQIPPFQGCCISNPCSGDGSTCVSSQNFPVVPGPISGDSPFSTLGGSSTSMAAASTITSTPGTLTTMTRAPETTTASVAQLPTVSPTPGPDVALIAGGAAGGALAAILVLLVLAFFVRKCYKKKRAAGPAGAMTASEELQGPANMFLSKGPENSGTPYNDGAYYSAGQPIFGVPPAQKSSYASQSPNMNLTPGPPSYQSPKMSPNRNTYVSEADSTSLHEVGEGQSPNLGQGSFQRSSVGNTRTGYGLGMSFSDIAELPGHSR